MEPMNNRENSGKDREFYEDMERIRQRRAQKKRKEKQKKRIFIAVACGCVLLSILVIVLRSTDKKELANAENSELFTEELSADKINTEESASEETIKELQFVAAMKVLNVDGTVNEVASQEVIAGQVSENTTETEAIVSENTDETETLVSSGTQPYKFESTSDTVNIYSEEVISTHAVLVDVESDTIIAAKGTYDRICPASMTKVLTVLVAAEAIEKEDLDDTFTMTLEITDYAYVNDCSYVGFQDGEVVTVRDLFYGTVLPSGGDAAVGLATYVAGSHEEFVEMMNAKLEELGLADSAHFTNCVGLYDTNHYCTVYDMAVIMEAAMENELCREVLSAHTYTTTPTTQHPEGIEISNWFLRRIEDKDTGGLVVGAKTGYVDEAGSCAVSYEIYDDGTSYICVTVGSTSSWRCIYDHVEIYNQYVQSGD